jgi:integrase
MTGIKVNVVEFGDRRHYQMQYVDPLTGRKKTRSTGISKTGLKRDRTEAERVAAKWEAELREGRYCDPCKTSWDQFRNRYESEVLPSLAEGTDKKVFTVFNSVAKLLSPSKLKDLTAERLSYYQSKLREREASESTIESYLGHLQAALKWAVDIGLLDSLPKIKRPRRAKKSKVMKGRPITGEEFDRMIGKIPSVVGEERSASWKFYLRGLWLSGLRLEESLELWWDREDRLRVDLSGKHPLFIVKGEHEKGNKDRHLPMAPEFAEFLFDVPKNQRVGRVFTPKPARQHGERLSTDCVSRTISEVGEAAKVKVNTDAKGAVKYASAQDLRRSFGERWAPRVMPQVLMELMRHESIETTLRYYVGRNAQATADILWVAHEKSQEGNISGNTSQNDQKTPASTKP